MQCFRGCLEFIHCRAGNLAYGFEMLAWLPCRSDPRKYLQALDVQLFIIGPGKRIQQRSLPQCPRFRE